MKTVFWFELLSMELNTISEDELISPNVDLEPNEQVVGDVPLELRKIYTRREQMEAEVLRLQADLKLESSEKEQFALAKKIIELKDKRNALLKIFWICLKDEFKLWGACTIGIRSDWRVVKIIEAPPSSLLDFLSSLFDPY